VPTRPTTMTPASRDSILNVPIGDGTPRQDCRIRGQAQDTRTPLQNDRRPAVELAHRTAPLAPRVPSVWAAQNADLGRSCLPGNHFRFPRRPRRMLVARLPRAADKHGCKRRR
jgi:hypothetical protein